MPMRISFCLAGLSWLAAAVSGQATLEWTAIPVPTGNDMVNCFSLARSGDEGQNRRPPQSKASQRKTYSKSSFFALLKYSTYIYHDNETRINITHSTRSSPHPPSRCMESQRKSASCPSTAVANNSVRCLHNLPFLPSSFFFIHQLCTIYSCTVTCTGSQADTSTAATCKRMEIRLKSTTVLSARRL